MKNSKEILVDVLVDEENNKYDEDTTVKVTSGLLTAQSIEQSVNEVSKKFAKPETYKGNRQLYDSGSAKCAAKKKLFDSGNPVVDPYTGDTLVLTKSEAKALYGDDWQRHLAESDHVKTR